MNSGCSWLCCCSFRYMFNMHTATPGRATTKVSIFHVLAGAMENQDRTRGEISMKTTCAEIVTFSLPSRSYNVLNIWHGKRHFDYWIDLSDYGGFMQINKYFNLKAHNY